MTRKTNMLAGLTMLGLAILCTTVAAQPPQEGRRGGPERGAGRRGPQEDGERRGPGGARGEGREIDFDEIAAKMIEQFDKNDDGKLNAKELAAALKEQRGRRGAGGRGRGGRGGEGGPGAGGPGRGRGGEGGPGAGGRGRGRGGAGGPGGRGRGGAEGEGDGGVRPRRPGDDDIA